MTLPLSGLRVIELGQLIAGPFASKILGEFGADVIKIEPPETGDPLRAWRMLHDGTSVWWAAHARNKRSITLNLRERPGTDLAIPILLTLDPNTVIDVVGGPVQMDGLTWWKVRGANIEGWCAGQYLGAR